MNFDAGNVGNEGSQHLNTRLKLETSQVIKKMKFDVTNLSYNEIVVLFEKFPLSCNFAKIGKNVLVECERA